MSESVKTAAKNPFLIDLDGEIVTLPGKSLESMMGMFAHLESLTLRRVKNAPRAPAVGENAKGSPALPKFQPFDRGEAERISFRGLGRQVIRAAQSQVCNLQTRTQHIQSLVLINNWKVADELWAELLPDCKTPLFELNFLEELWGISPDQWEVVDGWSLTRHWQQFVLIQAEVEVLLARRQSLLELSDTLEGHLGLWLKRFGEILEKLDEKSAA
jgi:hypothetical protein